MIIVITISTARTDGKVDETYGRRIAPTSLITATTDAGQAQLVPAKDIHMTMEQQQKENQETQTFYYSDRIFRSVLVVLTEQPRLFTSSRLITENIWMEKNQDLLFFIY
jgi:hypothetical protein